MLDELRSGLEDNPKVVQGFEYEENCKRKLIGLKYTLGSNLEINATEVY